MPLIKGCKYSCEPCIRGHRATFCAHVDRILIEVRKPGRPLQSCGHMLNSCVCGKLAHALPIGDITPKYLDQSISQDPSVIAISPRKTSLSGGKKNPRPRTKSKASQSKRPTSKTMSPTSASSTYLPADRDLTNMEDEPVETSISSSEYASNTETSSSPHSIENFPIPSLTPPQPTSRNFPPTSSLLQGESSTRSTTQVMSSQQQQSHSLSRRQSTYALGSSSRIEDLTMISHPPFLGYEKLPNQTKSQTQVRVQYVMATPDSTWRAVHLQGDTGEWKHL